MLYFGLAAPLDFVPVFSTTIGANAPLLEPQPPLFATHGQCFYLSPPPLIYVSPRETREGWPLPTVETEANGDSMSTYETCPSSYGSLRSLCRYKRFLSCLGCSSRFSTKYFFSQYTTVYQFICPHHPERWAGSRTASPFS